MQNEDPRVALNSPDTEDDDEQDDEDLDYYYYSFNQDAEADLSSVSGQLNNNEDPEYTPFDCLTPAETEQFLKESVESAASVLKVPAAEAKVSGAVL